MHFAAPFRKLRPLGPGILRRRTGVFRLAPFHVVQVKADQLLPLRIPGEGAAAREIIALLAAQREAAAVHHGALPLELEHRVQDAVSLQFAAQQRGPLAPAAAEDALHPVAADLTVHQGQVPAAVGGDELVPGALLALAVVAELAVHKAQIPAAVGQHGPAAAAVDAAALQDQAAAVGGGEAHGAAAIEVAALHVHVLAFAAVQNAPGADSRLLGVSQSQTLQAQVRAAVKAQHLGIAGPGQDGDLPLPQKLQSIHIPDAQRAAAGDQEPAVIAPEFLLTVVGGGAEIIVARSQHDGGIRRDGGEQLVHRAHRHGALRQLLRRLFRCFRRLRALGRRLLRHFRRALHGRRLPRSAGRQQQGQKQQKREQSFSDTHIHSPFHV